MDRDRYRAEAEELSTTIGRESYRHYAGVSDRSAVSSLYRRHAGLFSREMVEILSARVADVESAAPGDRGLLRFCVEGHLALRTAAIEDELAQRESRLRISVAGRRLGLRQALEAQAAEPDPGRRAAIERARLDAQERHLNPLRLELLESLHECTRELGHRDHVALYELLLGLDLGRVAAAARGLLEATDSAYRHSIDAALRAQTGTGLRDARRCDLPRLYRAPRAARRFPAEDLLGVVGETLAGLGLRLDAGGRIRVDATRRPGKSARAFCVPARVPDEVYLAVSPVGGREDYVALLHECGHAQHFAAIDGSLAFEQRRLGDRALGEAYAFLLDGLAGEPRWLARLGAGDAETAALVEHATAERLLLLRRYAAKVCYELELHSAPAGGLEGMAGTYSARLGEALGVSWPAELWLSDLDPGLYAADYLRAWMLEAQLRRELVQGLGEAWFERRAAGDLLRELWSRGGTCSADALAAELGGEQLETELLASSQFVSAS